MSLSFVSPQAGELGAILFQVDAVQRLLSARLSGTGKSLTADYVHNAKARVLLSPGY